jgi:hypothetical protein
MFWKNLFLQQTASTDTPVNLITALLRILKEEVMKLCIFIFNSSTAFRNNFPRLKKLFSRIPA